MASSNADSLPTGHPKHQNDDDTTEFVFEFGSDKPTTSESTDKPTTSESNTDSPTSESNTQPKTSKSNNQPTTSESNQPLTTSDSKDEPTTSQANTQPTTSDSRKQPISYSNGKPIIPGSKKPGKYHPLNYDPGYITRQWSQHGDRERGTQDR